MIPSNFPDTVMVVAPKNTPIYLRYCKLWKLYISRKKWKITRFHDMLSRQYGFKAREINRCYRLYKKEPSPTKPSRRSPKKTGQPGRKRKITKEEEDMLARKYKDLHRTGWSGVVRQLNTDVCVILFLFISFSQYF